MDTDLLKNPAQNNTKAMKRKAKKKALRAKKAAMKKNGPQNVDQMVNNLEAPDKVKDCEVANNDSEKNLLETDTTVTPLAEHPRMDAESTVNLSDSKKKKKRKKKKAAKVKDEVQSTDQTKIETGSTENLAEGNVTSKRKRKRRKIKEAKKDEVQSMDQANGMLNLHLSDGNHGQVIDGKLTENECIGQESEVSESKESEISVSKESSLSKLQDKEKNLLDSCQNEETVLLSDVVEETNKSIGVSPELVEEKSETLAKPMELEGKLSHHSDETTIGENLKVGNGLNDVNKEIVVDQEKCSPEGIEVKEAECLSMDLEQYPGIAPVASTSIKRKLLVLDVNGLLAYIVMPAPKDIRGDVHLLGRAIFKRPFVDDFLKFCFQNFDVGIWSSRSKRIIDKVVDYLLGDLRDKLLFCWDMEHSTQTGFKTLENCHKPLVCKELSKIWENEDPNSPWKKGDYDASNTLLLDDSPYKALLNPLHTAIFPNSFHYEDKNDNSLGPGGDLRVYLEGLLVSENAQKYVEQHPFGQSAINETNLSWGFYSEVLQTLSDRMAKDNTLNPSSLPTSSSLKQ